MRNTQIHLDRLAAALARHHVTLPRHALLEATAASHGFRHSKDLAAAMRGTTATPPAAKLTCTSARAGHTMAELVDPIADLPYSMAITAERPAYGVSPYGNLLELSCLGKVTVGDATHGSLKDEVKAASDGYPEPTPSGVRWETTGPRIGSPERRAALKRLRELLANPNPTPADSLMLRQAINLGGRLDTVGWCASTPCDVADEQVRISSMARRTETLCHVAAIVRTLGTSNATLHEPDLDEVRAMVDSTTSVRLMLLAAADGIMMKGLARLLPERRDEIETYAQLDQALMLRHVEEDERRSDQRAMDASRITRLRITAEAAINMRQGHMGPDWALPGDWLFETMLGRKYRTRSAREMLEVVVDCRNASFEYVVTDKAGRAAKRTKPTTEIREDHPSQAMSAQGGRDSPLDYALGDEDRPTLLDVARHAYVAHSLGMGDQRWIGWTIVTDIDDGDQCTCQIEFAPKMT